MNFDYNEEQQLLADSVRRFLQKDYDFEARRKIVASPEAGARGSGRSSRRWASPGCRSRRLRRLRRGAVDLMGVMEAFGEALVSSLTLPPSWRAARGAGGQRGTEARHPAAVRRRQDEARLRAHERKEGEKLGVVGAPIADKLVISSGVRLFLADRADVKMKPYRAMDNMVAADLIFSKDRAEPMPGADRAIEETTDFATRWFAPKPSAR